VGLSALPIGMDVSFAEMHSWGTSVRKVPSRLAPNPPFYSCPTIFSTPPTGEVAAGEFADLSLPCPRMLGPLRLRH